MNQDIKPRERALLERWVLSTAFGWFAGFVLVVALAMMWDAIGGGAQFMVGVGMGAGVGYAQSRVAARFLETPRRWLYASVVGMGLPFLLVDLASALGPGLPFSLAPYAVVGGALAGALQARLLTGVTPRAYWWIPASAAGWLLATLPTLVSDLQLVPGIAGASIFLCGVLLGGVILGLVTGGAMRWILTHSPRQQERA